MSIEQAHNTRDGLDSQGTHLPDTHVYEHKVVREGFGRPPKITREQKLELVDRFEQYIEATVDPTVPGFLTSDDLAMRLMVNKDNVRDWKDDFSHLVKRAIMKQEAYLLGVMDKPAMAIFRLKQPQHGYTDRTDLKIEQEVNVTHSLDENTKNMLESWQEHLKGSTRTPIDGDTVTDNQS